MSLSPLFTWRSAITESCLPATARHVALSLSLYMNEKGGSAFPGASRLTRDTGLSLRSVRTALGQLVAAGYLEIVERGGLRGEERHANHYRATTPLHDVHPCSTFTGAGDALVPVQEVHPTRAGGAPQDVIESAIEDDMPATHHEPTHKPKRPRTAKRKLTALPDDWQPSDRTRQWARENYPHHATKRVLAKFKDHAGATGRRQLDWDLAFRNWIRNEADWHPTPELHGPTR